MFTVSNTDPTVLSSIYTHTHTNCTLVHEGGKGEGQKGGRGRGGGDGGGEGGGGKEGARAPLRTCTHIDA